MLMFIPFYSMSKSVLPQDHRRLIIVTSTSFLLLASLAFNSIGVNPSSFATRCALVVFPIPGDPVIMTARNMFMPCFPGFLKPDFRLVGLPKE